MTTSAKTLAVLQPSYLPWLGYFDQMRRADVFVLYDDVQYDRHGWRNRNRIKTADGPLWLTVPVLHSGLGQPYINKVMVDRRTPWRRKHLSSLGQSYAKASYANEFLLAFDRVLQRDWERLVDLNYAVLTLLAGWLGVTTPIVMASELGIGGGRSERLLAICRHFGATRYLSGDAAETYLDLQMFTTAGVEVEWQRFQHPVYPQQHGAFVPYLSAADLIMNCGPESSAILDAARRSRAAETGEVGDRLTAPGEEGQG
jgi:hypothetical protein